MSLAFYVVFVQFLRDFEFVRLLPLQGLPCKTRFDLSGTSLLNKGNR